MNKEYLEALAFIKEKFAYLEYNCENFNVPKKELNIVEQALQRLETIDNAEPTGALKSLEVLEKTISSLLKPILAEYEDDLSDTITANYFALKQALIKAQEQEDKVKAFDLINEKDVDIKLLKWAYPSVEAYNVKVRTEKDYWWRKELTQEEFEFIGRLVGAE